MRTLRIGLCQINTTVGDIEGNTRKILDYISKGKRMGVDLLAFPEMAVTGYPPEDLLLMTKFIEANLKAVKKIARATSSITVVVGFVNKDRDIFNAAALLHHGKRIDAYAKSYLPNYGVFDENRYFQAGRENFIFTLKATPIGLSICEDLWYPGDPDPHPGPLRRSGTDCQYLGLPLSRGKIHLPRKDDLDPGHRQRGHCRLLQSGRGPG